MFRRVITVVLVVAVVLVGGGVALALSTRPDLEHDRDVVEQRWRSLLPALDERYLLLAGATEAVRAVEGPEREVLDDLDGALAQWRRLRDDEAEVADQVRAANVLEGLGRRLSATVADSPRLSADDGVTRALAAYGQNPLPDALRPFTTAVREYEDTRSGTLRRLVAPVLGYDTVPVLELATEASTTTTAPAASTTTTAA